jgi:hypothetical protein
LDLSLEHKVAHISVALGLSESEYGGIVTVCSLIIERQADREREREREREKVTVLIGCNTQGLLSIKAGMPVVVLSFQDHSMVACHLQQQSQQVELLWKRSEALGSLDDIHLIELPRIDAEVVPEQQTKGIL